MFDTHSIYIHVPFCIKKCGYCDFFSITDLSRIKAYTKALIREIRIVSVVRKPVATLYFGGGTPSVLPVRQIERIITEVLDHFDLLPGAEITLELNPGTVDQQYLHDLKQVGINRLSIGVQSFGDTKLKFLGRIHNARAAGNTIRDARKAGFANIGLDLIYGLPGETHDMWHKDILSALEWSPEHLSCYMLTLEKDTPLYDQAAAGAFEPKTNEQQSLYFLQTANTLTENGFVHYEISNFAKDESTFSRHNFQYWQRKPYIGMGPAAHSFDGVRRSWNASNLNQYIRDVNAGRTSCEHEILTKNQAMLESVMLGLRTLNGIDIHAFDREFDLCFKTKFQSILAEIESQNLGSIQQNAFILNLDGQSRLDSIVEGFADLISS